MKYFGATNTSNLVIAHIVFIYVIFRFLWRHNFCHAKRTCPYKMHFLSVLILQNLDIFPELHHGACGSMASMYVKWHISLGALRDYNFCRPIHDWFFCSLKSSVCYPPYVMFPVVSLYLRVIVRIWELEALWIANPAPFFMSSLDIFIYKI